MSILEKSFYLGPNVVEIAMQLLGKKLITSINGRITAGIISETEAYEGITDRASHAFGNRYTNRTKVMYQEGGVGYIYLCYGIHSLFNIVTNKEGIPHAVLIRGIIPVTGIELMKSRLAHKKGINGIIDGPGKLSRVLGIHYKHSGILLLPDYKTQDQIWLEDEACFFDKSEITITKRIGIDYAGEDAELPYRFVLNEKTITRLIKEHKKEEAI